MKKTRNDQLKRRRQNLMLKDPHCYWCGIEVIYFELPRHTTMPDNFATIDHLHTRYTPATRQAASPQFLGTYIETTVLACHKCNQERGDKETAALSMEEKRQRAGAYPQGHEKAKDLHAEVR